MKKITIILTIISLAGFVISGCKKEDNTTYCWKKDTEDFNHIIVRTDTICGLTKDDINSYSTQVTVNDTLVYYIYTKL